MPNAGALRGACASVGTLRAWVHSRAPRLVKRGTRRSISIAPGTCTQVTGMRDRVPPGLNIFLRAGWKPERAETRNPGTGSKGLGKPR